MQYSRCPQLLEKTVTSLEDMYAFIEQLPHKQDTHGGLYEYRLSKLATAGINGQFRTPRHIIRMMVELPDLQPGGTICDPACGTSGFLVAAGEYLKEHRPEEIFYSVEANARAVFSTYQTMIPPATTNKETSSSHPGIST